MWLFLKKCVKLNVLDTQNTFLVGNCWTSISKGKNNQPNTKKATQGQGFSWGKIPHIWISYSKTKQPPLQKNPSSTWGRKIILPKEASTSSGSAALSHLFYMDKVEIRAWPDKKMDFRNKMSWDEQSQHSSTLLPWQVPMSSFTITRLVVPVGIPEGWEQILLLSMIYSSTSPCAFPGKPCCLISLCLTV